MFPGLTIPNSPENPQYYYAVQWQKENMLVPETKDCPNIQDAMQFVIGNLAPYIKDIVFFSVTRRIL